MSGKERAESEKVILVDETDRPVGLMEKMEAHEKALLHRAFSVFIFDRDGRMLIQRRAAGKYHSPLLWTNACCSHPRENETTAEAADRRLREELGFSVPLKETYSFIYRAPFDNGLTEHEYDHVFTGVYEGPIEPHPEEVAEWKYVTREELNRWMGEHPGDFTEWFKIIMRSLAGKL